jgi:hypothetical protein
MKETNKQWIYKHILYKLIKGRAFDFETFSSNFTKLNSNFWDTAEKLIPHDWRTDQFDTIKDKITMFISQKNQFINELKIIMS